MKRGLMTLGLGAGLMYFMDPVQGPRRRALARDKAAGIWSDFEDGIAGLSRDLENRWHGITAEFRAMTTPEEVTDEQLVARVRSHLGRLVSHPRAIQVDARDHVVTLSGPVLAREASRLAIGVLRVRGVRKVENQLDVHEQPDDIPALQGPGRIGPAEWTPTRRVISGAAGATLALYGLRRGGVLGAGLALFGISLLARGITNQTVGQIMAPGQDQGHNGGRVDRRRAEQPSSMMPSGGI
jgi:hypothetical protein